MRLPILSTLLLSTALLGACNRPVEVIQPVIVPGPTGPAGEAGAAGKQGETGKTSTDTTVIVVPAPSASAPRQ